MKDSVVDEFRRCAGVLFLGVALAAGSVAAAPVSNAFQLASTTPVANVFQMAEAFPDHLAALNELKRCLAEGDYATMETVAAAAAARFPNDSNWRYNVACAQTRLGRLDEARRSLTAAVKLGYAKPDEMATDADLAILRRDKVFAAALAKARQNADNPASTPETAVPLPLGAMAPITTTNTYWDMTLGGFFALFSMEGHPAAAALPAKPSSKEAAELLEKWTAEGTAAGNFGDLYDNHDRGHSKFDLSRFPGMVPTTYSAEARAEGVDTGFSLFAFRGIPTIGNSSTANVTGPFWSSCARNMQTEHLQSLLLQYLNNVVYVYPQHNDYLESKFGDVFPTRTPYLFVSPGSSWTDQPILEALATALAALRPETKRTLAARGQLAMTLQYLLRASQTNVVRHVEYLFPKAHPVVFDGKAVDLARLATLAHSMTTNALPPVAALRILADESVRYKPGEDYPGDLSERLYDSPFSIARVWRAAPYSRKMVVEAANLPFDKRRTRFHWFVGQGDESKVKIREIDSIGRRVEISVDYHTPPFETPFGVRSSRVDVICIADNGDHYSAPAFVTWYFPPNELRSYNSKRLPIVIDYSAFATNYADLNVAPPKNFSDEFLYDAGGAPNGRVRTYADGREEALDK